VHLRLGSCLAQASHCFVVQGPVHRGQKVSNQRGAMLDTGSVCVTEGSVRWEKGSK
jgi:hypothetical protein